jgi:hypothetical protein
MFATPSDHRNQELLGQTPSACDRRGRNEYLSQLQYSQAPRIDPRRERPLKVYIVKYIWMHRKRAKRTVLDVAHPAKREVLTILAPRAVKYMRADRDAVSAG